MKSIFLHWPNRNGCILKLHFVTLSTSRKHTLEGSKEFISQQENSQRNVPMETNCFSNKQLQAATVRLQHNTCTACSQITVFWKHLGGTFWSEFTLRYLSLSSLSVLIRVCLILRCFSESSPSACLPWLYAQLCKA